MGQIDELKMREVKLQMYPDSKVHGDIMGPTWVLLAPDGPHVGPMNLAIRVLVILPAKVYMGFSYMLTMIYQYYSKPYSDGT